MPPNRIKISRGSAPPSRASPPPFNAYGAGFSITNILTTPLDKITEWAQKWIVKFNPLTSESLVNTRKLHKPTHPDLFMSNTTRGP